MQDANIFDGHYDAINNFRVDRQGDTVSVDLLYPIVHGEKGGVNYVEINQESVRASDGIRVTYDYERDGWSIQQPSIHSWASVEEADKLGEGWTETAFVQSWALHKEDEHDASNQG